MLVGWSRVEALHRLHSTAPQAQEMAPYMRCMLEARRKRWLQRLSSPLRCVVEVGYEALHNAGHRKGELKNFKCGVFVGDSGPILR